MGKIKITKTTVTEQPIVPIDNKVRDDWNRYLAWLDTKGLRGKPELDTNDLGNKMIDEYRKVNPTTTVSREIIPSIQADFANLKQFGLNKVKAGQAKFDVGVNENNFMQDLSKIDGLAGQFSTQHNFPLDYMRTVNIQKQDGKEIKRDAVMQNKGFLTAPNSILPQK